MVEINSHIYHIQLVVFSNNISVWNHLRDITTFIVYVTVSVLKSPSVSTQWLKLRAMYTLKFTCTHIVFKICYF